MDIEIPDLVVETDNETDNETEETEDPLCGVCQEHYKDKISLTCKAEHEFCFKCITKWWFSGDKGGTGISISDIHVESSTGGPVPQGLREMFRSVLNQEIGSTSSNEPVCPLCRGGSGGMLIRSVEPDSELEHVLSSLPRLLNCCCNDDHQHPDCKTCRGLKNKLGNMVHFPYWLIKVYDDNKEVIDLTLKYRDDKELLKHIIYTDRTEAVNDHHSPRIHSIGGAMNSLMSSPEANQLEQAVTDAKKYFHYFSVTYRLLKGVLPIVAVYYAIRYLW